MHHPLRQCWLEAEIECRQMRVARQSRRSQSSLQCSFLPPFHLCSQCSLQKQLIRNLLLARVI
jgi:hypothetical protein